MCGQLIHITSMLTVFPLDMPAIGIPIITTRPPAPASTMPNDALSTSDTPILGPGQNGLGGQSSTTTNGDSTTIATTDATTDVGNGGQVGNVERCVCVCV